MHLVYRGETGCGCIARLEEFRRGTEIFNGAQVICADCGTYWTFQVMADGRKSWQVRTTHPHLALRFRVHDRHVAQSEITEPYEP